MHIQRIHTELQPNMQGQFRLWLYRESEYQRLKQQHPDWPHAYLRALCVEDDTGWVKNTITDYGRRRLVGNNKWTTFADLFIHESVAPGDVSRTSLQFIYGNQTPSQVVNPDTDFDADTLLQTRTKTFTAPAVARNINVVGLTALTAASVSQRAVHGIAAYSKLSSTRVQGLLQTADVEYKVTWSLE
jgi:hypothetical protein